MKLRRPDGRVIAVEVVADRDATPVLLCRGLAAGCSPRTQGCRGALGVDIGFLRSHRFACCRMRGGQGCGGSPPTWNKNKTVPAAHDPSSQNAPGSAQIQHRQIGATADDCATAPRIAGARWPVTHGARGRRHLSALMVSQSPRSRCNSFHRKSRREIICLLENLRLLS